MVKLIRQRARTIAVDNNIIGTINLQLVINQKTNANYSIDNKHCRFLITFSLTQKDDPSVLRISVVIEGEFEVEEVKTEEDKKRTHVECYNMLFPYVQRQIVELCLDTGLPPIQVNTDGINLSNVHLNPQNI